MQGLSALAEIVRALEQGAKQVIYFAQDKLFLSDLQKALAKLEDAGFQVKRASYWNMLLFPVVVAVRLLRREGADEMDDPARSDIVLPLRPVNAVLSALTWLESKLMRYVNLPFGSSVVALAIKPGGRRASRPSEGSLAAEDAG